MAITSQTTPPTETDFFQLSPIYKLYILEKNYTYADNDLKAIMALIRCIAMLNLHEAKKHQPILEPTCIDNTDEFY